ncbi:MAG: guanylate kinase [Alphaproteobacteria bacterium]|nr:guanylate kinase [Alphaproteobacteria bacterium]
MVSSLENGLVQRRGLLFVLSSPSGAGKTTVSRLLLAQDSGLSMSVSVTTRQRRPGEVAGIDYQFVDLTKFNQLIEAQELLEYAKIFDHYYGTPRQQVEKALIKGQDVLFDIDWQGTQQLAQKARDDLVSVFILPPSMKELERRLRSRDQDSKTEVAKRMATASDEMSHWAEYDYVIINIDLQTTLNQIHAILRAERLKRERQGGLHEFVKKLREGQ